MWVRRRWSLSLSPNTWFVLYSPLLWWRAMTACLPDEVTWVWRGHCDRAFGHYWPPDDLSGGGSCASGLWLRSLEPRKGKLQRPFPVSLTAATRGQQTRRSGRRCCSGSEPPFSSAWADSLRVRTIPELWGLPCGAPVGASCFPLCDQAGTSGTALRRHWNLLSVSVPYRCNWGLRGPGLHP